VKKLAIVVALLSSTASAHARGVNAKFLMDFLPGLSVPIADGTWRGEADPSFKFSLRTGAELWFSRGFAFAGEIDLDISPQMRDNGTVAGRVRALAGFRLVFGFGVGAFFIRHAMGLDYSTTQLPSPGRIRGAVNFAVEPGVGLQFKFARRGVAGFVMDFPTAFYDDTSVFIMDVQLLGLIGMRI
jgi:hypothetical protein